MALSVSGFQTYIRPCTCTLEAIVFSLHPRVSQSIEWSLTQRFSSTLGTLFWNQINVRVTTMDAELEFAIQPNTTGKQLFDQVSDLGIWVVCNSFSR
ncbi:hypothetical protein Celaphus_00008889 [Cervus elaphus hippelaphus]|uniref:Uncharacterized protein n=1 Tax=Cervus elaphus hippelaphus TaxID=46360 RepID=A0A212DI64_CEREH|nr:hypothetical protein Celaphus_00008889 [Cervus elaphus hippelaphus]